MKDNWGSDFGNIFNRRYDDEINSKLDVNIRKSIRKNLPRSVGAGLTAGLLTSNPAIGLAAGAGTEFGSAMEKSNKMKKAKSGNLEQKSLDRAIKSIDSLLKCLGKAPNDGLNIKNVTQSKGQVFSSKSAPKPKNKKRSS